MYVCILKRAMSRLSFRRCSRVRHPSSSSILVTLDVLLYRRRYHQDAVCLSCYLAIVSIF